MNTRTKLSKVQAVVVLASLLASLFVGFSSPVGAAPTELFFSEYIEGSSYNKALEIYNGTGAAVDLAAGNYSIAMYFNGSTSAGTTIALTGTVADGDVYVVADDGADAAILAETDQTSTSNFFNGDDTVVLLKNGVTIDVIGQIGVDPGDYWGSGDLTTQNHTLRRKGTVEAGDTDGSDLFDPTVEWDGYAVDTFDGLGTHSIGGGPEPGQPLPLVEDFDDCTLAGWEIVSVDADAANTWSCSAYYSNIEANGYGDSAPANEWLITPPLNLDAQEYDTLTFRSYTNYTDINYPQLHVLYSTDYDGSGDPTSATWTELSGITFSPAGSGTWTDSGDVDLSGISGTNVYLAFNYVSSGTGGGTAATWRLDAINIFEGTPPSQPLPLSEGFDDCTLTGWEIVSVDEDTAHTWSCNATYSNIEANGYGDTAPADEWLITPPLNLDAQGNDTLTFRSYTNYTDINYPQLHVLYSTDYAGGGDPTSATWTELSGITFSPAGSGTWTDSGDVDLSGISGTNVYLAFNYVSSGTGGGTAATWRLDAVNVFEQVVVGDWVLNEIHADPDATAGDANGDGVAQYSDDEFVEIFNNSGADVDVGGWTLSDAVGVRHTFPAGTVVPASCAIVVFGGGTPTGAFGGSVIQTASTGALGLNNSGDSVTLFDGSGNIAAYSYGGEGGDNQSLTRDPDITGPEPLVKHTTATGSGGALFSPGTMVDGTTFAGCVLVNLIHDIQGSGATSPLEGSAVTIEGIVVGDFQNNAEDDNGDLRGFYVQEEDADADADPLTSEGVFVYDGYSPAADVMVGDFVRVKGQVAEYNGVTEITYLTEVTVLSSDNELPTPATVNLPLGALTDLEAYEGMSVILPQSLYISEYYNFDRYGEIILTSARQNQPTAVYEPGSPEQAALAQTNLLDRITLDDGRTTQNPDPAIHPNGDIFNLDNLFRGGDTVQNVTGVVDYYYGYKIQPTMGADYVAANSRTAAPDDVGGNLKVASFNVLNYFTTLDDGINDICGPDGIQECRGADDADEFTRQQAKIVAAMCAIDADVFGLMELENTNPDNDPDPGDDISNYVLKSLVDALNASGSPCADKTYAFTDSEATGTDAIQQGIIYKTSTVTPLGRAVLDAPSFTDPLDYDDQQTRPAVAQTFMDNATGGVFTVVVNHLKSKSCYDYAKGGDLDLGDGQACFNESRALGAQVLADWLATDPTGSGDADFLIIGDLNAYDKEDPIDVLLAGGYTDLIYDSLGEYAYSYVFDGQVGYLDHALSNSDLLDEVTGTTVWHINADEPDLIDYDTSYKLPAQDALYAPDAYRSSDHDPVIIGLNVCDEIAPEVTVTVTRDTLWPPNHKYVTVHANVKVTDNLDRHITPTLVSVTSNEPDDGLGDGDQPNDILILTDFTFKLRAERSGGDDDRVYTITYQATDSCGNVTIATATVTVLHDQGE